MQKIRNKFRFFKETRMTILVLLFLLVINVIIIIGGCFFLKMLPENRGLSLSDALWESLKLILDPGGFLGNKLSAITTIVTSLLVLCGMVTFSGGIIGYVTNVITDRIEKSKNGIGELKFEDYTLILNWNKKAMGIILDRVSDLKRDNKNDYIVILAEQDKQELEKYIADEIKSYKLSLPSYNKFSPRIVVRNGKPQYPSELDRVNYHEARTIFIMQPEEAKDPDYEVLKTYYSLVERNSFEGQGEETMGEDIPLFCETKVVVETSDFQVGCAINNMPLKNIWGTRYCTLTLSNEFTLGKIYAQILLMPEIEGVYKELLSLSGARLVEYEIDQKNGDFIDEMKRLKYSIPIYGCVCNDGSRSRTYITSENTTESEEFEYFEEDYIKDFERKIDCGVNLSFYSHTIFIHGINKKLKYILNSIKANNVIYPNRICKVQLIAEESDYEKILAMYEDEAFHDIMSSEPIFVKNYYDVKPFISHLKKDFHSMIVLAKDEVNLCEQDKNVFLVWSSLVTEMDKDKDLEEILDNRIILEITNYDNARLLESSQHKQLVVNNQFISMFMTQMAEGETIQDILLDMLSTSEDEDFKCLGGDANNFCDLLTISIKNFFDCNDIIEFNSKQECVCSVFEATKKEYIPIGCVKMGTTYMFTNGKHADTFVGFFPDGIMTPNMADSILIEGDDKGVYTGDKPEVPSKLVFNSDDYLIVIRRNFIRA